MKALLLVDDNDRYAAIMKQYFEEHGYTVDRAETAAEGLEMFRARDPAHYPIVVTDVTMESQLAGISMLRKMRRQGYPGTIMIASTGFDVFGVIGLTRLLLRGLRIAYLIPKTTILARDFAFYPMSFFSPARRNFVESGEEKQ